MSFVEIPTWMLPICAVLFGACIGSFLNVCIYRLPRRESLVWPGSRCTSCGRQLSWYDNLPILSWVTLGGRCRTCKATVSSMYPIVEAVTALAFLGQQPPTALGHAPLAEVWAWAGAHWRLDRVPRRRQLAAPHPG